MNFSIEEIKATLIVDEKELKGYAFMDEEGRCIIITYGEKKRDILKRYLSRERIH